MVGGFFAWLSNFLSRFSVVVMVSPWEQAIRVRAGRQVRRLHPGIHLLVPILDTVHKQTVRRRNSLIATQTLTTADGETIVIGASLGFEIADIERLYRTLHDADDTLCQLAAAALADVVLTTPRADLTPGVLGELVTKNLAGGFDGYGIAGVELRVTDFAYIHAIRLVQDQRWGMSAALNLGGAR